MKLSVALTDCKRRALGHKDCKNFSSDVEVFNGLSVYHVFELNLLLVLLQLLFLR